LSDFWILNPAPHGLYEEDEDDEPEDNEDKDNKIEMKTESHRFAEIMITESFVGNLLKLESAYR
jgi:hypothetical protein